MNSYIIILISVVSLSKALMEAPLEFRKSWEALAEPFRSECICEIGVSSGAALDFFLKGQYTADLCTHCYIKCINVKLNLLSASTNEVVESEFLRQVAGTTPPMVSKCSNVTKSMKDPCLRAYYMYECIVTALLVSV